MNNEVDKIPAVTEEYEEEDIDVYKYFDSDDAHYEEEDGDDLTSLL